MTNGNSVQWIDTDDAFGELIDTLAREPRFALDTEFHRERTYRPKLALVQIAWSAGIALVDPLVVDVRPLAKILQGDAVMVAHAADQDLAILEQECGARPTQLFDTQVAAGFTGMGTPSLSALCTDLLQVRLAKGDQLADWTRRPLGPDQLNYAACDVAYLFQLQDVLTERLSQSGRLQWALDECDEHRRRQLLAPVPEQAWWKLKGSRNWRGDSRGVAQELAAWRERTAAQLDIPVRFVLPDLALQGMAQRPPRTRDEVSRVRGIDGRQMKPDTADAIVAAVQRGQALASDDLVRPPREPSGGPPAPVGGLLAAWVTQKARDLGIDSALLATRSDIDAFVRGDTSARIATGWRAEAVAEPIRRIMRGELALVVRDGRVIEIDAPATGSS
ncbi:MAG: ribonuclease D [Acidimicrobiia bacterium]